VPGAGFTFSTPGAVLSTEIGDEVDSLVELEFLLRLQPVSQAADITQRESSRIFLGIMGMHLSFAEKFKLSGFIVR